MSFAVRPGSIVRRVWGDADAILLVFAGSAIPDLPEGYAAWRRDRREHLARDLAFSAHTAKLYEAYRRDLGPWRFTLLQHLQGALVPALVRRLARLPGPWLRPALTLYPALVETGLHRSLRKRRCDATFAMIQPPSVADAEYARAAPDLQRRVGARRLTAEGRRPLPPLPPPAPRGAHPGPD